MVNWLFLRIINELDGFRVVMRYLWLRRKKEFWKMVVKGMIRKFTIVKFIVIFVLRKLIFIYINGVY